MAGSDTESVKSEKQSKYRVSTTWKPGQSGNPKGRPPKGWSWAELLEDVGEHVHKESGKKFKHLVSERLWIECANGNIGAIKELFNRMEGMPKQSHDHTSNGQAVPILGGLNVHINNSDEKNTSVE